METNCGKNEKSQWIRLMMDQRVHWLNIFNGRKMKCSVENDTAEMHELRAMEPIIPIR